MINRPCDAWGSRNPAWWPKLFGAISWRKMALEQMLRMHPSGDMVLTARKVRRGATQALLVLVGSRY